MNFTEEKSDDLEKLFTRFNYRTQILRLADKANALVSECIKISQEGVNSVPNTESLLDKIAEVEILLEQFRNHFPKWDDDLDRIICDKINLILSRIEMGI